MTLDFVLPPQLLLRILLPRYFAALGTAPAIRADSRKAGEIDSLVFHKSVFTSPGVDTPELRQFVPDATGSRDS
jgi:hypothetical protein